ncbi:epoxide hydrolase hyl1 [Morchella snyderi]|nr:epoxide hydrolase hyl1 [Morchella snyderi]
MSFPKKATLSPVPFKIEVPQKEIDDFKALLRLSQLPPPTWEATQPKFGVQGKWMSETKEYWETKFDWRSHEAAINKHPQYMVPITSSLGATIDMHFIAHLSSDPDAVPLLLLHGWPGSFIEFLDLLDILSASTAPAFNIIVPSLPGYAFSSVPPLDRDFGLTEVGEILNTLMVGLGFGKENGGYISQGGDIGSFLCRLLQEHFEDCKAIHLNSLYTTDTYPTENLTPSDLSGLQRAHAFRTTGSAYGLAHATRPSTIGHVLASSPLALLAWVGEKLLEWTDEDPSTEAVLRLVTLWWFTKTAARAIYPYRQVFQNPDSAKTVWKKPVGYSMFPKEIVPTCKIWAEFETGGKMVWFKEHETGGHFTAMEKPKVLAEELVEFVVFLQGLEK